MEPNSTPTCSLCFEFQEGQIHFSCGHILCPNCFCFILFDNIKTKFVQKASFYSKIEYPQKCIICHKGSINLSFDSLFRLKPNKVIAPREICDICEDNEAKIYCFDCKKLFCDEHLAAVHDLSKKYGNHQMCSYNISKHKEKGLKKFVCNCPEKIDLMFYCQTDQRWICKCCARWEHENHIKILRPKEIQKDFQQNLKILIESFQVFERIC